MIIRSESRSLDSTRYASVVLVDADAETGMNYVATAKDRYRKSVAEWRGLPSPGTAQRLCTAWVEHGQILRDPEPAWVREVRA